MASFDFFTQARGPEIDIDLFPRARQMGAQTGNLIKTPLQAGIEGAIEGVKTGFSLVDKYQEIQIQQNQIDQQPVENQIRQNQARIGAIQADIAETQGYINSETEAQQLELKKAELDQKVNDIRVKKELTATLSSSDPKVRASVIDDPKYIDIFSKNPALFEEAVGKNWNLLTPDQQESAARRIDFMKAQQLEIQKERQNAQLTDALLKNRQKVVDDFNKDGFWNWATSGLSREEALKQIEVYPAGTKTIVDGKIDRNAPDRIGDEILPSDKGYDVFRNGVRIRSGVDSGTATKFSSLKNVEDAYAALGRRAVLGAPSPADKVEQQMAATQAAATGGTNSGLEQRLKSFETPQPTPTVEPKPNATIVEQARAGFNEVAKNPPQGMQGKTLEERLFQKKNAYKTRLSTQRNQASKESFDILNAITPTVTPSITPRKPIDTSTPDAALSSIAKQPVKLRLDTSYRVPNEVKNTVLTNPLLDAEPPLYKGLATVESQGKTDAVSPTGVRGLYQVTKATAAQYGLNRDVPEEGILAGKLYLADLTSQFNGNIHLALAGYNAGPDNVAKAVDDADSTDWNAVKKFLPNYVSARKWEEVKDYPDRVLSAATAYLGLNEVDDRYFYAMLQVAGLVEV